MDQAMQITLVALLSLKVLTNKVKAVSWCMLFAWLYMSCYLSMSLTVVFNPLLHNTISFLDNNAKLEQFIRLSHSENLDCINQQDRNEFTPLYLAMTHYNPNVARLLLELGVDTALLHSCDSGDWVAPLVLVQENIVRTCKNLILANILKPYNTPLADQAQLEQIVKEALGNYPLLSCLCGSCDRGWLSAKMRVQLQGSSFKQVHRNPCMKYIPLGSRTKAFLIFYWGYQEIVNIIHDVLTCKGRLLNSCKQGYWAVH
jgi:ankyrin repeat protein